MELISRLVSPRWAIGVGLAALGAELAAGLLVRGSTGFVVAACIHFGVLLLAALACWAAVRVGDVTERSTWRWFAAGLSVLALGSGISAATGALELSGLVALGELVRLGSTPCFVAALWRLPHGPNPRGIDQYFVDAGIALSCFLLLAWLVLHESLAGLDEPGMGLISVLRPVVSALLGTATVMALVTGRSAGGVALARRIACSVGVLLIAFGDGLKALDTVDHGHPTVVSALVGTLGCVAIVWTVGAKDDGAGGQLVHRQIVASATPLLPVLASGGVVVHLIQDDEPAGPVSLGLFVVGLCFVIVALVHGRFGSFDTREKLEREVSERTMRIGTRERWFQVLVQNSSDVVTVIDPDGVVRYQTPSALRVLGHDPKSMVGADLTTLLDPADAKRLAAAIERAASDDGSVQVLEFPLRHRDGHWLATETVVTSLIDEPNVRGIVLNTRDVSERRRLQNELMHQAYSDALTGLANRSLFRDRTRGALDGAGPGTVAILFLDLNGFKTVNDTQGHAVGDRLLALVGQRLRSSVRPGDLVARLGGDEFGILVTGARAARSAEWVADRVVRVLAADFELDGRRVPLGTAIGIAVNDRGDETADDLLVNADLAMYRCKADVHAAHVRFESSMHAELVARVQAEADLRRALDDGQLELHYQPVVRLADGALRGVEALMRWSHPTRGVLEPGEFIDLAEQTGLVDEIGAWAVREACRQAGRWQRYAAPGDQLHVGVNVSTRQLVRGFPRVVADALEAAGVGGSVLTLEVTESALMDRPDEAARVLAEVRALGVRIAVDDFGTGYSSLSYLARFPVDVLKIDRSFVRHLTTASDESELARTIVQLAESLGLTTVAEGIETAAQQVHLMELGCAYGQGYHFARPMTAEATEAFLARGPGLPRLPLAPVTARTEVGSAAR